MFSFVGAAVVMVSFHSDTVMTKTERQVKEEQVKGQNKNLREESPGLS